MRIAIVSGGFDPVHSGHVAMIGAAARRVGGPVLVLLNSDDWLARKKGAWLMPWGERAAVLRAMRDVWQVLSVNDRDGTVADGLVSLHGTFPRDQLHFCNGGDRTGDTTPEIEVCERLGILLEWGVGGGKKQSSSDIVADYLRRTRS